MALRNLVLLATAWMFCCIFAMISAQSTRGMQIQSTVPISASHSGNIGLVLGTDASGSRALVTVGNNRLFAVPFDNMANMGNPIFQTWDSGDQIVGAWYDSVNASIFVCTRVFRRIYWLSGLNANSVPSTVAVIRSRGETSSRFWNACAFDSVQRGIWVATEDDIGYLKNIYNNAPWDWWITSDYYGTVDSLRTVVIQNNNVFFGGASGYVFVTSVNNVGVSAGSISRLTRGVGQILTMATSPGLNRVYIGGDQGVLTEIDASTFAFTRISFTDDASILSIQVDNSNNALFLNAVSKSTPTSKIIRINLDDTNFEPFGVLTFPTGVSVNTGILDPRNGKFQMLYVNYMGDAVTSIRSVSCSEYTCSTCDTDTNYCGYCSTSRACVTPNSCAFNNFYTTTYVCPALSSISPSSGSTDGGTVVTVTGQFTDPAGNTLTSGFECQWGSSSRISATVINGATIRCTSPSGTAGDAAFRVYYSGSLWTSNSLTFSYYSCSALTGSNPCANCFSLSECGICIPTMQCASSRGCTSGFSTACPVIGNISPASASIVGNTNFTITLDRNINANYQCLYTSNSTAAALVSTVTPATLIRSNTLTCRPPVVTAANWFNARGNSRELNVDLVIKVSTSSAILASKFQAIYLFDCDTYGQDCSGCTSSLTQGECGYCFDLQACRYSTVSCDRTGTCPSISSVSPARIFRGALTSGVTMSITGRFAFLSTQTFVCAFNAIGDSMGVLTTPGTFGTDTAISCPVPSTLAEGNPTVSLWIYTTANGGGYLRVVPNFSFAVYTCAGTSCATCLDGNKPECVFCSSSAECTHSSASCSNTKLTSSASCPSITTVAPTSASKSGNVTVVITGAFAPAVLASSVSCLWSSGAITPTTYSSANEVRCVAPAVAQAATGTVTLSVSGNAWTNSLPFLWYDCAKITGDCSNCISAVTPKCTWCTSGCDEVCEDTELKTDVCPSLTTLEPNYGYVLGGETISVVGGPFYSRANFTYECHFGDKVSPAVVESINTLTCATPTSLVTQTVDVTVWMNGLNYAPFSSLKFTYYDCQTFSQTSCNSFCMAQPHCGWCVASSSCTSASRCTAQDDVFLTQCLSVTSEPNHMSIFGNSNVTLTFTPRLPDFLLVNSTVVSNVTAIDNPPASDVPVAAPVAVKRALFQTPDALVTCQVTGLSPVAAYITGIDTVTCALPASGLASRVSLSVLYKGSNLFTPIDFSYVDCETTTNCDDCSRKQYCGWCLQENTCSTLKRCSGDWADGGCPSLISITPDSASASGGEALTLVGEYFINHPSIKILMGNDAAEYEYINSTTMTVIVIPGTADESIDISMMFNDKKYSVNTLSFTWVSPFSVPGLAAGMSIAGALMIGGGIFYYLFTRYQKRRQGLFVQVKEPDYEKVAYQNEMVQHFRVTSKDDYVELEDILMNKDRTFLRVLVAITAATEYDAVAKALVYLSHHKGIGSDLIQFFASDEVRKSTSENTIFRQNSMASKMFKFYSQIVGTRFLFFTLARVINELNTVAANAQKEKEKLEKMGADTTASLLTIEMEVDPNKLKGANVDKDQNVYQLALACQKLFTAIVAADENVPAEFRQVFIRIQSSITEQYGDSEAIYKALGGFLFLRFVCPAITAPHYYGLLKEPPNSIAQRQLVLIAKVLQNLANLANTKKEAFMESMLDFIERNKPKMITYYKSLLNPEAKANPRMQTNLSVPSTVRENSLAYLHTHIYRNQQKMKAALAELPDPNRAKQLSSLVDRIVEKYGEPPKRLKDKGGPVRSAPAEPMEKPEPKNVTINNPVAQVGTGAPPTTAGAAESNTNQNNRPVANRPNQQQYGTARRNQFPTLREPFFISDMEPEGNILEDNVFTDTIVITEANMFDNPFDINFEPMANELDFEVFDNPLLDTNTVGNN